MLLCIAIILSQSSIKSTKNKKTSPSSSNILSKSLDCIRGGSSSSLSAPKKKCANRIDNIFHELLAKEREYIDTLKNGIENYVELIDKQHEFIEIPKEICHEKFKLFGNIEEIYELHKKVVLPAFEACDYDVTKLAAVFTEMLENDTFYCYIKYGISHINGKEMITNHWQFFHTIQVLCNDRLGIQSFVLQPIQKLPRYYA